MADLLFDKRTEGFTLSGKSRDILRRYAKAHNIQEKTKTLDSLLEEYDAFANPTASSEQPQTGDRLVAAPECTDGHHCEAITVMPPKTMEKSKAQEKAELVLEIWKRKREIDINAKIELAMQLARIHRENTPYRGSQSSRIEMSEKGGSVKLAEPHKSFFKKPLTEEERQNFKCDYGCSYCPKDDPEFDGVCFDSNGVWGGEFPISDAWLRYMREAYFPD
jgi:hypothetical protein